MTAGKAIDGVLARLDEAREAQVEKFAQDIMEAYPLPKHVRDEPAIHGLFADAARRLVALGYRKAAP